MAASIHFFHFIFLPPLKNFHVFLPIEFVSFVHVNVDIKIYSKKDSAILSKSPGGHAIYH